MTIDYAIFGAGAWGTALALALSRSGASVALWTQASDHAQALQRDGENKKYLPGFPFDDRIVISTDRDAAAKAPLWMLAVPAQSMRGFCRTLPAASVPAILCAKGFERESGKRLSQVFNEERPGQPVAILSGPSFAHEVAAGLPTAVTLGCATALGRDLSARVGTRWLRTYWSDDVIGVELGGAVKNVLAIAAGIVIGKGLGENARAALLTRGLAEMTQLGLAMGAQAQTFAGLSGLGDLMLTATSLASRNTALGHRIGTGLQKLPLMPDVNRPLAEGVATASACRTLAERLHLDLPILCAVDHILQGEWSLDGAIDRILSRPIRPEH